MIARFTIARLMRMPRPEGYIDELRAVAIDADAKTMTFETESDGYKQLQKKYADHPREEKLDADEVAIILEIDKQQPGGLGDTLKNLFEKIGVDKAAKLYEKITGSRCACEKRRKWLNENKWLNKWLGKLPG